MNVDAIIIGVLAVLAVLAIATCIYTTYETGYRRGFNEAADFCRKRIAEYRKQEAETK